MKRNGQAAAMIGLIASLWASAQLNQPLSGTITGVVLNEGGQPLRGAHVTHVLVNGPPSTGAIRYADTNNDGQFRIDHLQWGSYWVFAMKEGEGYPNFGDPVYGDGRAFMAKLSPENPSAKVLVIMGPKAGTVTGQIVDAETGRPVADAGMHMWRWNEPAKSHGGTIHPQYQLLAPADIEVGLEITADGYETWIYPGDPSFPQGKPLVLKSGQRLNLDIRLQPKGR